MASLRAERAEGLTTNGFVSSFFAPFLPQAEKYGSRDSFREVRASEKKCRKRVAVMVSQGAGGGSQIGSCGGKKAAAHFRAMRIRGELID